MSTPAAPLILLPGLMCDSRIFAGQLVRFPEAIAIDGFGTCDSLVAMAHRVLSIAPRRISLLGHSMGARVALEVLRIAPKRVERLALVSTGVHAVRDGEADQRHALLALGRAAGAAALVDRWLPPMVAPAHRSDHELLEPLHAMCASAGVDAFGAQITALLHRPEAESLLSRIRCPTLVAVGEEDDWSPPRQHRLSASRIAGARLQIIPGAGHMLPAEAAHPLNEAIAGWLEMPAGPVPTTTGDDE